MNDRSSRISPTPTRKPYAARRLLLMTSVVTSLALCGYAVHRGSLGLISSEAHAQVGGGLTRGGQPAGFSNLVEKAKPSVISVKVTMGDAPDESGDGETHAGAMAQGSGFFISPDGYAVTNNHVVENAAKVEITTDGGKTYKGKIIGTDKRTDLALIKVEGGKDFPYAELAGGKARIGDWVVAVGNPFGLGGTVTAGIVSANGRDIGSGPYDDFIQIDAPVNKGNSGGPSFNMQGEVVGVNTAIYSPSGGNVGIAFAIPASTVKSVISQLRDTGTVNRGWLGVQIQPVTQEIADSIGVNDAKGALVTEAQPGSPAAKAGIKPGDVITSVNDDAVKDAHELSRTIAALRPGNQVKLAVMRDGKSDNFEVTLGKLPGATLAKAEGPQGADGPRLGLTIAPAGSVDGAGDKGVVVTSVDPMSAAADRGFKEGDVILEVAGRTVTEPAEVSDAIKSAWSHKRAGVLMRVRSGDQSRYVAVPLAVG